MDYEIISINENTWRIENNGVRFFLLTGAEKALLIDSGMTIRNAREIAGEITVLPLSLLNTHADIDHIGSNAEFEAPYMHPAELSNYHNTQKTAGNITPVWDGDIIDLGQRELEIIHIPGHTPGSIAVLDRTSGMLFSGDPVQDGHIFMFGVQRDLSAYRHSLIRLKKYEDRISAIYPSHGTCPVGKEITDSLISASEKIMRNEIPQSESSFMGVPVSFYDAGVAQFLCEKQ